MVAPRRTYLIHTPDHPRSGCVRPNSGGFAGGRTGWCIDVETDHDKTYRGSRLSAQPSPILDFSSGSRDFEIARSKFYGTLGFERKVGDENLEIIYELPKEGKDKCLYSERHRKVVHVFAIYDNINRLENLSCKFLRPNTLDAELGTTRLWDGEANGEKKAQLTQPRTVKGVGQKREALQDASPQLTGF